MPDEPSGASTNTATGTEQDASSDGTNELQRRVEEALASTEGYKALQRSFAKQQKEFQQLLTARDAEISNLKSGYGNLAENQDYVNRLMLDNLPQAERDRVEADLRNKQVERLTKEQAELRKRMETPAATDPNAAYMEQLEQLRKDAVESLRETVQSHGLDPKAKGLDFGEDDESFPARLKKLNQSIAAVKKSNDQADVETVRQKVTVPPTRTNGGSAPGEFAGKSLLSMGAAELLQRVREGEFKGSGRAGRR